jgi:hypothetical protein
MDTSSAKCGRPLTNLTKFDGRFPPGSNFWSRAGIFSIRRAGKMRLGCRLSSVSVGVEISGAGTRAWRSKTALKSRSFLALAASTAKHTSVCGELLYAADAA